MFLKRVEIIGFKSFAEKIGIDFVPGVTAVVGPNGSGKSNITDAIRWVLGEQSAKSLRGTKMEDVIFAGSDSRKPLNFAEVTLILDNSKNLFPLDYTEISVTRRVFRSGESVYLLNGQQCRLKDINNVFLDSGVGKEAFSIISQGRVDEILNSKPEDRRSIFDEAAGVLKYRNRKRKAEHKLFETSDNLDRVLDILKELDVRMEPLKAQAEAAERHSLLVEEVEQLDVQLINYDAGETRSNLQEKYQEVEQLEEKKAQLTEKILQEEAHLRKVKTTATQQEEAIEHLQEAFLQVSTDGEKWEGRRLLSAEKERNANMQAERIEQSLAQNMASEESLEQALRSSKEKLASLDKTYQTIQKKLQETNKMLNRSESETENEIDHLKSLYIDYLNEEATIRNDLKHIEERLQGEAQSTQKIDAQYAALEEQVQSFTKTKETLTHQQRNLREMLESLQKTYDEQAKILQDHEKDLNEKQALMQQAHNRQHEMQGRLRALKSLEEDFSGFYSGVKEVLQAREHNQLHGIEGAVAELITMDQQYIKAVETALGGAMQHIITTSEKSAREAIHFLKTKNRGRATFLPMDVIRPRTIPAAALKGVKGHAEYVGLAAQLIEIDESMQHILENLLGNVLVAKSLAGATAIAKDLQYRYRVVTLDGDVVNAGGSLTGGGTQHRSSVFSRKAELETLTIRVDKMTASIERGQALINDVKMDIASSMQKMDQTREEISKVQKQEVALQTELRECQLKMQTVQDELKSIEIGRQGAASAGSELLASKAKLEKRHLAIKASIADTQDQVTALERLAADWRNEEASLTKTLGELREQAAILGEQIAFQKKEIRTTEEEQQAIQLQQSQLKDELTYLQQADEAQLSAAEIAQQIEDARSKKIKIEQALQKSRVERTATMASAQALEEEVQQLRQQAEQINTELQAVKVSASRMEVTYETLANRLWNEYGLKVDASMIDGDLDLTASRERMKELKREVNQIGPVNPGAVQEYAEVSERHQFLSSQRNDLLQAKETLQAAMTEMDEEMTTRFSTTFDAIQHQFRHVFKEMFGGGNADLILTNPDDLLHTGVDIIARPPGKKMQSLSLLSGGERALTAISLLFSIIEVRPVPFCILDEVEAALDEANVTRYSDYLKRFSNRTQFIVITHRKGTMEGADVLYGITMQESGVSKVISVKLSEVPEEAMM